MKLRGRVVEFDTERQFGFIRPDGQIKQVLVRLEALELAGYTCLASGERVEFKMSLDNRYIPVAIDVRRLVD